MITKETPGSFENSSRYRSILSLVDAPISAFRVVIACAPDEDSKTLFCLSVDPKRFNTVTRNSACFWPGSYFDKTIANLNFQQQGSQQVEIVQSEVFILKTKLICYSQTRKSTCFSQGRPTRMHNVAVFMLKWLLFRSLVPDGLTNKSLTLKVDVDF